MKNLTLITKPSPKIFNSVRERDFIVQTHLEDDFSAIYASVKNSENRLAAIFVKTEKTVSEINFQEKWRGVPLLFYVSSIGKIRDLWKNMNLLKQLDITFFFPADYKDISTSISFLASLGINSGFYFQKDKTPNYEGLKDVLYYSFYPKIPIGNIQPYSFIEKNDILHGGINFSSVFFDNPEKFLWVDLEGNIAFNEELLNNKQFIKTSIEELYKIEEDKDYKDELLKWHEHFLKVDKCSACPAWRICKGSKEDICNEDFQEFMSEIVDVASDVQTSKPKTRNEIWQ